MYLKCTKCIQYNAHVIHQLGYGFAYRILVYFVSVYEKVPKWFCMLFARVVAFSLFSTHTNKNLKKKILQLFSLFDARMDMITLFRFIRAHNGQFSYLTLTHKNTQAKTKLKRNRFFFLQRTFMAGFNNIQFYFRSSIIKSKWIFLFSEESEKIGRISFLFSFLFPTLVVNKIYAKNHGLF